MSKIRKLSESLEVINKIDPFKFGPMDYESTPDNYVDLLHFITTNDRTAVNDVEKVLNSVYQDYRDTQVPARPFLHLVVCFAGESDSLAEAVARLYETRYKEPTKETHE